MYNKTVLRVGFCDIQNNQGLREGYHLDYSGYHKNPIQKNQLIYSGQGLTGLHSTILYPWPKCSRIFI